MYAPSLYVLLVYDIGCFAVEVVCGFGEIYWEFMIKGCTNYWVSEILESVFEDCMGIVSSGNSSSLSFGWYGIGCGGSSNGFSLALTSLYLRDGFALNAITGGCGKISLR